MSGIIIGVNPSDQDAVAKRCVELHAAGDKDGLVELMGIVDPDCVPICRMWLDRVGRPQRLTDEQYLAQVTLPYGMSRTGAHALFALMKRERFDALLIQGSSWREWTTFSEPPVKPEPKPAPKPEPKPTEDAPTVTPPARSPEASDEGRGPGDTHTKRQSPATNRRPPLQPKKRGK